MFAVEQCDEYKLNLILLIFCNFEKSCDITLEL